MPASGCVSRAGFRQASFGICEGWLYLALVLDLYSRKIVGWAMSESMPQPVGVKGSLRRASPALDSAVLPNTLRVPPAPGSN